MSISQWIANRQSAEGQQTEAMQRDALIARIKAMTGPELALFVRMAGVATDKPINQGGHL